MCYMLLILLVILYLFDFVVFLINAVLSLSPAGGAIDVLIGINAHSD